MDGHELSNKGTAPGKVGDRMPSRPRCNQHSRCPQECYTWLSPVGFLVHDTRLSPPSNNKWRPSSMTTSRAREPVQHTHTPTPTQRNTDNNMSTHGSNRCASHQGDTFAEMEQVGACLRHGDRLEEHGVPQWPPILHLARGPSSAPYADLGTSTDGASAKRGACAALKIIWVCLAHALRVLLQSWFTHQMGGLLLEG